MQIIGFYCSKQKKDKEVKVKEIQIDVDKIVMQAAVTLVLVNGMTVTAWAGPISSGIQPIIEVLKDLAEPVAYGFMVKGFLQIMAGTEHEGKKTIKYSLGGFLGIQLIPKFFELIKNLPL